MKLPLPDSIAARTFLLLVVVLMASHTISMSLYFSDRWTALMLRSETHIGERMATMARIFQNLPPDQRQQVAGNADAPQLRLRLLDRSVIDGSHHDDWMNSIVAATLMDHLEPEDRQELTIRYIRGDGARDLFNLFGEKSSLTQHERMVVAAYRLEDGVWLNMASVVRETGSFFSMRFVLSMAIMIAAAIIIGMIVVRYITGPLARFSEASYALGRNVDATHMPVEGPREVRDVATAFNRMQSRLKRFVNDRTAMIAAISHDLRTPITRLRLRAEFVDDHEQQAKMLRDLAEMEKMIDSTLSFARDDIRNEEMRRVDVASLLQSICDEMSDAGHEVTLTANGQTPLKCRPVSIKRALTNLIGNAVKYGGNVEIRLSSDSDRVRITIQDDGPGIPETEFENVFTPFYRLEQSRNSETGGAGLGLSVARNIIRGHGGDVMLKNRPEGGLSVEAYLPTE